MRPLARILFPALLALGAIAAQGQSADCGPLWPNDYAVPYNDIASGASYSCLPVPSATSTGPLFYFNSAGAMWAWGCKNAAGRWGASFFVATWPTFDASKLAADIAEVSAAPDPLAAFNAKVRGYALLPANDPRLLAVRCPFESAMYRAMPVAPPTAVTVQP